MEKKRAAIYIRVSTEDQSREGFSLENQLEDCKRFIKNHEGWEFTKAYKDVESGFINEREQYQDLIEDAESKKFEILLVWKVDRLTRKTSEGIRVLEHLIDKIGVEFYSCTEPLDTKTAYGRKALREMFSSAEFERERLIERVMPGMVSGVKKGHWQGARYSPYGYRYNKKEEKLEEVPEEINAVKTMFNLSAEGTSIYSATKQLYDLGYRNRYGKPYTTALIGRILRRKFYLDGHLLWTVKKKRSKEQWEIIRSENPVVKPIIDQDTWDKAQATLEKNNAYFNQKDRKPKSTYILQGVVKCRHCQGNMAGRKVISNHRTGAKKDWYHCCTNISRTSKACRGQDVKAEDLHQQAYEILKVVVENKELLELTKDEIREMMERKNPDLTLNVDFFRKELNKLAQQQEKCKLAYYNDAMTLEQFKEENMRLEKEKERVKQELSSALEQLYQTDSYKANIDNVFALLNDVNGIYDNLSPSAKKLLYRSMFKYIIVEEGRFKRKKSIEDFELYEPFATIYNEAISEKIGLNYQWKNESTTLRHTAAR